VYHLERSRPAAPVGPQRWKLIAFPLLTGILVGLAPLPAGWPYWGGHTVAAALAVIMPALLAAAGTLLAQGAESRTTGFLLIASALLYATGWVSARNTGPYPLIGEFTQTAFFLTLGVGILLHGRHRFDRWFEWAWAAQAFVILFGAQLALTFTVGPERIGYAADVSWPDIDVPASVGTAMTKAGGIAYVVLALTFVVVLVLQEWRPTRGTPRNRVPLIVVSGVFGIAAAVIQYPIMATGSSLAATMSARNAQGTSAIILPLTLFAAALRATWVENTLAAQLIKQIGHATPGSVQVALRVVLRDPRLEIWYWVESAAAFVDEAGRIRRPDTDGTDLVPANGFEVHTPNGVPLALCLVSPRTVGRNAELRAALEACAPALQAVQLQLAEAEQVRDIQDRLMAAEHEGRRELARDLHDGVQQDLAAIRLTLDLMAQQSLPAAAREQLSACDDRIVAVIDQVRAVGRGLHPRSLAQNGLAGALEEATEGLDGLHIHLEIPAERFHPRFELAMYYILNEALTNVVKHAEATAAGVRIALTDTAVIGEMTDNGRGGAVVRLGGGLHGIEDRVRALRGRYALDSPRGRGTRITVTIPRTGGIS
jgi:signal transduction histidine kinase